MTIKSVNKELNDASDELIASVKVCYDVYRQKIDKILDKALDDIGEETLETLITAQAAKLDVYSLEIKEAFLAS